MFVTPKSNFFFFAHCHVNVLDKVVLLLERIPILASFQELTSLLLPPFYVGGEGRGVICNPPPSFLPLPPRIFCFHSEYGKLSVFFWLLHHAKGQKWDGEKREASSFFLRLPNKGKGFLCHDLREERIKERGALVCYEFRFCPERCWRIFHLLKTNIYVSKKYFCSK